MLNLPMTNESKFKTQIHFFQQIKNNLPAMYSFVDEIADVLQVSNDSAYRRIRGETALSLDEAKMLCQHFKISLDSFFGNGEDTVTFVYKRLDNQEITFENYLASILMDVKSIEKFENKEIIYAAKDIPIFHHFAFPELAAFKIFFWMKSVLNIPSLEKKLFDTKEVDKKFIELGKQILKIYEKIPAIEIWTDETINSTLKQLEYFWESGFFLTEEDALLLCDQFAAMLTHIQHEAETSVKFFHNHQAVEQEGNYKLYYSEVMIGNNNILVTMGDNQMTYLTHNTLNYLVTTNPHFCQETDLSLKNMIKKSTLISGVSEKQRNQFFRKALNGVKLVKNKIEGLRN